MKISRIIEEMKCAEICLLAKHGINLKKPLIILLDITNRCNSRCSFCDLWKKTNPDMPFDAIKKLIDEFAKMGTKDIIVGGGEPLVRKDCWEIIKYIHSREIRVQLVTNAIRVTDEDIENMGKYLDTVGISLDTVDKNSYKEIRCVDTFDTVIKNIKRIVEGTKNQPVRVGINCVINKRNYKELLKLYDFVKGIGVDVITFQPVSNICAGGEESQKVDFDALETEIKKLIEIRDKQNLGFREFKKGQLKISGAKGYLEGIIPYLKHTPNKDSCFAGHISTYISAAGDVFPCYQIRKPLGNIYNEDFKTIWNSKEYESLRKDFIKRRCEDCWWICHNGRNILYNHLKDNIVALCK